MRRRRREDAGSSPAARRRARKLALVMAVVVAAAAGGFAAGDRVRSPAEAAADRAAPTASPVGVPVERRALSNDLTRRGSVRFDNPTPLSLAGPVGGDDGSQLVTWTPSPGVDVAEGDVVLEVSGRPVIALQGEQPMYRTLRPGDEGKDVAQVEEALARLGFDPGAVDGTFDAATEAAIAALYASIGYAAQEPSDAERSALTGARTGASDAVDRVAEAEAALAEAARPTPRADLLGMENEVAQAERALDAARAAAARTAAQSAATVAERAAAVAAAQAAHATATDALSEAQLSGIDPADPIDEPGSCTATCIGRLEADVAARAADIAAAETALAAAGADADSAAIGAQADVASASAALDLARIRLVDARAPKDTARAQEQLDRARTQAADAAAELAALDAATGTTVPAGEIVFLPGLPLRLDDVKAEVGEAPPAGFASVSGSRLAVDSSVDAADADLVQVGQEVTIEVPGVDRTFTGTIAEVADTAGTDGATASQVYVRIAPSDDAGAAELNGAGVVVTIPIESTGGEVLVVPIAALTARADGSTWVEVLDGARRRDVPVDVGLQADGLVEVSPAGDAELAEGDRVVVGEPDDSQHDDSQDTGSGDA